MRNAIGYLVAGLAGAALGVATVRFYSSVQLRPAIATSQATPDENRHPELDYSRVIYRTTGPWPSHGNTLADRLATHGITEQTVERIRIRDFESLLDEGIDITPDDFNWDSYLATAEPYKYWTSSGYRYADLYLAGQLQPAATLCVNGTDATHVKGIPGLEESYMCHGLNSFILRKLGKKPRE